MSIPSTQRAVQLVGPDRLALNETKPVPAPAPGQVLCRVVVVGLCFSDLKLLKQFSGHVRKAPVVAGVPPGVLEALPSYVPGEAPTVPGHEPVVEIAAVGAGVERFRPGERYFVQADWRWVRTSTGTNGAFGYNFEGALQEYVLLDERLLISPEGECMLMPAPAGERAASAFALVEPWACVEDAYQVRERQRLREGGARLIVADLAPDPAALRAFLAGQPSGSGTTWCSALPLPEGLDAEVASDLAALGDAVFDDVLYFGADADTAEALWPRGSPGALFLLMRGAAPFGRAVQVDVGAVHYRGIRLAGTAGLDPAAALAAVPADGEMREGDAVHVIGAGGPMGVMHVVRDLCQGVPGITVHASDLSDERLAALERIAGPLARRHGATFRPFNAGGEPLREPVDYAVIMAPVPALVAASVAGAAPRGIVNIFAGIPLGQCAALDLDAYVERGLYMIGTSGSLMADMRIVLRKVEEGRLDTNVSVAAVSGLDGAIEGIRAVERQAIAGKIMVYPACRGLGLTPLEGLPDAAPEAAAGLRDGIWTREAEDALRARWET